MRGHGARRAERRPRWSGASPTSSAPGRPGERRPASGVGRPRAWRPSCPACGWPRPTRPRCTAAARRASAGGSRCCRTASAARGPSSCGARPCPRAYRVFFRHVGLDPDVDRPPAEAAILDRLLHGGFRSAGLPEDALLLAVVETGVPVWALDAAAVDGPLGVRTARAGRAAGGGRAGPRPARRAPRGGRCPRPGGRALRRRRARARAGAGHDRRCASSRWGWPGSPRSTSRRRCGRAPKRSSTPPRGR